MFVVVSEKFSQVPRCCHIPRSAKTVKLKPTRRMMRRQRRDMDGRSAGRPVITLALFFLQH
jgi:hypothetical protein